MAQERTTNNLSLWNEVGETDPAMTRKVNQRGGFTAIDSYYQLRRATEVFGPLGIGWGYTAQFRFEHNLAIAVVDLWYTWDGKKSEPFTVCASNQYDTGKHVDEDAAKKALTDALTKGLSYLGFSSDVFMGKFDDNRYVESLRAKKRNEETREQLEQEVLMLEGEMNTAIESVEDAASYAKARECLIPTFLRLKAVAPQLAEKYEQTMKLLKAKYATPPQGEAA